jgi:choline dehydrogenase
MRNSYDYIIIGAGAAGCVIAERLTKDSAVNVLLLEAGTTDTDERVRGIGDFAQLWGTDVDWKFPTEPQPGLDNRVITIDQGKLIGGGTSINAMMYVRGNARNFDLWNAMGADGWSYCDVLPTFRDLEDYEGGASEYRGAGGPLRIKDCPDDAARCEEFMVGATEAGFDGPYWDTNGERQENGAGLLQFSIDDQGKRVSGGTAFLDPAKGRSNLAIETGAEVTKLLLANNRAVGVSYVQNGESKEARTESEVVVCGGAFLSPKLLMLSGIGPAEHLRSLNIPVAADLPGVGQNLCDHVQLPFVYKRKTDHPNPTLLTGNLLFFQTREGADAAPPDMQLNFTPAVPQQLMPMINLPFPACIFLAILVQPFSLGEVKLRSADPTDAPVIDPKFLSQQADVNAFVKTSEVIDRIANTKAFSGLNDGRVAPSAEMNLVQSIRAQGSTLWHPVGTCKLGRDHMAVVDPDLKVYGIDGLRVADSSVMPTVTSGNVAAPTFMIAWRAADKILESRKS